MPIKLDIKSVFTQRSDRVKGVDLHPTEPWILACLYNGHVYIWNYVEGSLVKSFEVTDLPVRTAKFVPRKQWIVCGADDMHVRVYNYNTMDKVKQFEAHSDYIRHVAVHPTLPYLLTCSDDMLIKLWDWDKGWACTQVFEGHSHYVMHVVFNPKDTNTFASASLDRTVKVWSVGSPVPNFTLDGHEKGVNCVDYYGGGDRPYLASGADDRLVKVWDYQTKACLQTLEGHAHNVTCVAFHPELPLLLTGGEDGSVRVWHGTTFRLEQTLEYGLERAWGLACAAGSSATAIGYDEGVVMVRLGRDEPLASMDAGGKIVWARHNEIATANVRSLGEGAQSDGERLPLAVKDLGASEQYPQYLAHSPNGRFVAVCGDGEYVVYTALAWRNKAFGPALDFAWADDGANAYAVREAPTTVKIMRNFKEALIVRLGAGAAENGLRGGALLAALARDSVAFYDWATGAVVRRVEAEVREVYWSDGGARVALVGPAGAHVLAYDREAAEAALAAGEADEDGVEDAFELVGELGEAPTSACWVGECLIYTAASLRLCYVVGGETTTLAHADRPLHLLGYLAATSRVYLLDKAGAVVSYALLLPVVEFKTRVLRGDVEGAVDDVLADETVPASEHGTLARFLEARGHPEAALRLATDPAHRFELALALGRLDDAAELAARQDSAAVYKALGEAALERGDVRVAGAAFAAARDRAGQLLLAAAARDAAALADVADAAAAEGARNVAFAARWLRGDVDAALDLLLDAGRLPEAALLARAYRPSRAGAVVALWRADLAETNPKAAEALADPAEYPNLFPGLADALAREREIFGPRAGEGEAVRDASPVAPPLVDDDDDDEGEEAFPGEPVPPPAVYSAQDTLAYDDDDDEEEEEEEEHDDVWGAPAPATVPDVEPAAVAPRFTSPPVVQAEAPPLSSPPPPAVFSPVAAVPPPVAAPVPEVDDLADAFGGLTADEEALLAEEGDALDIDVDEEDDWGLEEDDEEEKRD